jgi:hypothetical protein
MLPLQPGQKPCELVPSFADLLRDHPEVVQGQAYPQDSNSNPQWHEPQPARATNDRR